MAIRAALLEPGADVALVIGGTGPGNDDHSASALSEAGELAIHGVALLPGETTVHAGAGRRDPVALPYGGHRLVLLPGGHFAGRDASVARLAVGARHQIPPKTANRISNGGGGDCQFLLLQGVGAYDFNKVQD
jgi:hypothetical protein